MNRVIYLFSISLLLGSVGLFGQRPREIEFSVYGQYQLRGIEYAPVSDAAVAAGALSRAPVMIETYSLARKGPHSFNGGSLISFYETSGKQEVAQITLADVSNKWLLIFVKNPGFIENSSKHLKYLIHPFDDSRRNLPKNSVVFVNISGKQLGGLLENKRVTFMAGESNHYRALQSLPVNLWTRGLGKEVLLPVLIKTYSFKPDYRYLIIFFPPVLRGSADLDVRFLSEAVE